MTKRIKILYVPNGSEPDDIMELLVGLRLTVKKILIEAEYEIEGKEMIVGDEKEIFIVNYDYFLRKLKIHNEEAFQHFLQPQVRFKYPYGFRLSKDCCKKNA